MDDVRISETMTTGLSLTDTQRYAILAFLKEVEKRKRREAVIELTLKGISAAMMVAIYLNIRRLRNAR